MPQLVVTENSTDPALLAAGKALVTLQTGQSTQRVETTPEPPKYHFEFRDSVIFPEENAQKEIVTLKVTPATDPQNFLASINADFSSGERTNHFFKLPALVDLASTRTESSSTSKSQASYSFETVFNYISEDYDRLQVGISEQNLYAPFDTPSIQDFLNILNSNSEIINFGRGDQMKNYVVNQGVQQGSKDSPYYNHLRINQRINNGISRFAVKLGIFDELLQDYLFGEKSTVNFDVQQGQQVSENTGVEVYSLENFLTTDRELDLDNFFTLSESIRPSRMSLDLRKHLLRGFLKNASSPSEPRPGGASTIGFRRFKDIYDNVEAHKEVFCYSVAKHAGSILDSTLIQTFYVPALEDSTPLVDTQVKYGKNYAYKVVGHYMVIGNSYEYRIVSTSSAPDDTHAIIKVTNRPSIVLLPFDIFTKNINVVQMPPVYPQVSFKTKNDAGKSISIYLSPTKTDMFAPFTIITKEDEQQLEMLQRLPNGRNLAGNFKFKTYGDQGLYEVFRLSDPPKSYSDFKDAKIGEISMPFNTTDAIFRDPVVPNKKYYYMFRSVNQKGMVSNPTTVYETTLLIDADESKIVTDTYSFPKPRNKESALEFRKLLRITPAVEHILFDEAQPALFQKDSLVGTLDDLNLGIAEKAVWGRKFKIRIKSKTSGKMIDIILNVDLTKNKTEEEF